jgi:long-subunit fatty acid transport protein
MGFCSRGCSIAVACAALLPNAAFAGGLDAAPDGGAEALGRGAARLARFDDPLDAYFNPAAMSFQANGIAISAHLMIQSECFARKGPGNTTVSPGSSLPGPGDPNGPAEETCADAIGPNPQIGAVFRPTDRFAIGLAVVPPHSAGQGDWPESVDYTRNGQARTQPAPNRYMQVERGFAIVAYPTISMSYAVTPDFSIGAGFVWGLGTIDFSTYTEALSPTNADDFFGHQDVKAHIKSKDFFIPGFVASLAWHASSRFDVAAWYRWSDAVRGTADLQLTSQTFLQGGEPNPDPCKGKAADCNVTDAPGSGSFKVNIPMEARVAVRYHHPLEVKTEEPAWKKGRPLVRDSLSEDRFDLEADLTWSNDSAVDAIRIRFGPEACQNDPTCVDSGIPVKGTPGQVPVNGDVPHQWRDVLGVRLGSDVTVIPNRLALRGGGFFESKGQRDEYLNLDFDRAWKLGLTLGGTVRVGPADLYVAYAHTFFGTLDNGGNGAIRALSGDGSTGYRSQQAVNGGRLGASLNDVAIGATFRF